MVIARRNPKSKNKHSSQCATSHKLEQTIITPAASPKTDTGSQQGEPNMSTAELNMRESKLDAKIQKPRKHRKQGRSGKRSERPKGTHDKAPRPPRAGRALPENRNAIAEYARRHAYEALNVLVDIMNNSESAAMRVSAANRILKRLSGKVPKQIDTSAIKHTEIVYRTVDEIKREIARRGLPVSF